MGTHRFRRAIPARGASGSKGPPPRDCAPGVAHPQVSANNIKALKRRSDLTQ